MEGEGFEPPEDLNPRWFSRPVHSARLCPPSIDYYFILFCDEFTDLYIRVFNFNQIFLNYSIIVCLLLMRLWFLIIFEELNPVYLSLALLIKCSFRFLFFNFNGIWVPFFKTKPKLLKWVFPTKKLKSVSRPFKLILS